MRPEWLPAFHAVETIRDYSDPRTNVPDIRMELRMARNLDGRSRTSKGSYAPMDGILGRALGRRHARHHIQWIRRPDVVDSRGSSAQRPDDYGRTVSTCEREPFG